MKTEVMLEANTTNSASYANFPNGVGNDQFRLREAFIQAGNVLESQPDAKFWAGERYYRRQHIEINDFYPLDMSGYGGGVEDLNVKIGKLAVAYLAGARPDIVTENGYLAKNNVDVRLYDLKGPAGLWGGMVRFRDHERRQDLDRRRGSHDRMDTRSDCVTKASSGTAAITRSASNTEPERRAISALRSTIQHRFCISSAKASGGGTPALPAERQIRHHADLCLPADEGRQSAA